MNLKYIMWFVKALSYFALQRNFQMVILYFARVQSPRDWKRGAGVLSICRRKVNMDESSSDVWHNFDFGSYFLYKPPKKPE